MKAVGDWVWIAPLKQESKSGLLSSSINKGTVIATNEEELLNKVVLFNANKVEYKVGSNWIVALSNIFGVEDNE